MTQILGACHLFVIYHAYFCACVMCFHPLPPGGATVLLRIHVPSKKWSSTNDDFIKSWINMKDE